MPQTFRHRLDRSAPAGAVLFVVVGALYAAGAELAFRVFGAGDIGLVFFPAAGLTLGVLAVSPVRRWPWVVAAIVVAEVGVDLAHATPVGAALGYAAANAAEPLLGASLLRRGSPPGPDIAHRRGVAHFVLAAVIAGPALGGLIGGISVATVSPRTWHDAAVHWWAGDALGVLVVGLLVISATTATRRRVRVRSDVVPQLIVAVAAVVGFALLQLPPAVIVLPLLTWMAVRGSLVGSALASAIVAFVANISTAWGHGPFAALDLSPQNQGTVAQLVLAATVLTAWFLTIEVHQRNVLTALHAADLALRERAATLQFVGGLSADLVRAADVDAIARTVRTEVRRHVDAPIVLITVRDPASGVLRVAPDGLPGLAARAVAAWPWQYRDDGEPVVDEEPVWLDSAIAIVERYPALEAVVPAYGIEALAAIPLLDATGPLGHLVVGRGGGSFTPAERADLLAAAQVASHAVQRALLQEEEAARLQRSEERFRSIADRSPLVIWTIDANGRVDWANHTFGTYFGVDRTSLTSDMLRGVVHPDDATVFGTELRAGVAQRRTMNLRVRVRRADGTWRWLESWGEPQFEPGAGYLGHVCTSADITDHIVAEQVLERAAARERYRAELLAQLAGSVDIDELERIAGRLLGAHLGAEVAVVDEPVPADPSDAAHELGFPLASLPGHPGSRTLQITGDVSRRWLDDELADVGETVERLDTARRSAHELLAAQRRGERARAIRSLVAALDAEADPSEAMRLVADALVPEHADSVVIEVPGPEPRVLARRPATDEVGDPGGPAGGYEPVPAPCVRVPIDLGADLHAVLIATPRRTPGVPLEVAREFFEDLARRVGVAVATARVRRAEHDAALALQRALLPDTIQWDQSVPIEARYAAASSVLEVGGDWYDTFRWPDRRIGAMVGDVVGHSLESAVAMGRIRAATAALAAVTGPDPAALLDAMDRFARGPDGTEYATAACAVVDPANGHLTYASAGHPPILLVHASGAIEHLADRQSPPLCLATTAPRRNGTRRLEPGTIVVLYSDGLIERRGEPIDDGIARLERALLGHRHLPLPALTDAVLAEMTAAGVGSDDIVLTCLRYTPAKARLHVCIPARDSELAVMHRRVDAWLGERDVAPCARENALLAVGEASAHAIGQIGQSRFVPCIDIEVADHGEHLVARVRDQGRRLTARARRGPRLERLTSRVRTDAGDAHTTVTMVVAAGDRTTG